MLLFRAMNDFDIIIDPLKNGLASKKLIYDATKRYLYNTDRETIEKLSIKDRDNYIKNYMNQYLLDYKYKLGKIFIKQHMDVRNRIHRFVENKDDFAYCQMIKELSSLPNHLINGSRTYTNWISTTNNFDGLWNYYDKQNIHNVAVLNINTNGVFNDFTYAVDLSNKDVIEKIRFISNKIDNGTFESFISFMKENNEYQNVLVNSFNNLVMKPTDKKFMGYNFAVASNEYSIYEYIPKEAIVAVLESLHIDLICANIFNLDYLSLSSKQQRDELEKLKKMMLKHIQKEEDNYMLYVFEELYLKNHNILDIDTNEKEKIILMRNKIISKSQYLPSILIKR